MYPRSDTLTNLISLLDSQYPGFDPIEGFGIEACEANPLLLKFKIPKFSDITKQFDSQKLMEDHTRAKEYPITGPLYAGIGVNSWLPDVDYNIHVNASLLAILTSRMEFNDKTTEDLAPSGSPNYFNSYAMSKISMSFLDPNDVASPTRYYKAKPVDCNYTLPIEQLEVNCVFDEQFYFNIPPGFLSIQLMLDKAIINSKRNISNEAAALQLEMMTNLSNGTNIDYEFMPFHPSIRGAVKSFLMSEKANATTFSKIYQSIKSNDYLPQNINFISVS